MPDISMCDVANCPNSIDCHRHSDSGTKPSPFRQSYIVFPSEWRKPCKYFWPTPMKKWGDKDYPTLEHNNES